MSTRTKQRPKSEALWDFLHERYISGNPERERRVQQELVNAEVAEQIYQIRQEAGLTQRELARLVGTSSSAISRLEDADYRGHSLSMLQRIAKALNKRLEVRFVGWERTPRP